MFYVKGNVGGGSELGVRSEELGVRSERDSERVRWIIHLSKGKGNYPPEPPHITMRNKLIPNS